MRASDAGLFARSVQYAPGALCAWGQQDWTQRLPEGTGKETAEAVCAGRPEFFARLGSGYTPQGWRSVVLMLLKQGAPVSPNRVGR